MVGKKMKASAEKTRHARNANDTPGKILPQRRKQFINEMLPNSVAFVVSNPESIRSNDTEYPYRQSSDVLYLSNFPEPQTVLLFSNLEKKSEFKMLVRPKDKQKEIWTGRRFGVEGAVSEFGCAEAYTIDQFAAVIAEALAKAKNVYYKFGVNEEFDKVFEPIWKKSSASLHNPELITHNMRMVKSAGELKLMKQAAAISAQAHCVAMQMCKAGMMEYEIQAELEHIFKSNGASGPAYSSIVATGDNAIILHYIDNNSPLSNGQLLLIDAACEYKGYASDITRTFPVGGKFSEAQLEIYELVLEAQKAAIAIAKPGVTLKQLHEKCAHVLRQGLIKLGVLMPTMSSLEAEEQAIKQIGKNGNKSTPVVLRDLFMHGTSHWLGLDVHDVGTSGTRSVHAKVRPMEVGMVFTVEPGLYFDPQDKRLPKKYRGIGIRIEDDVVITAKGCEVITDGVPKDPQEIEELMAG